MKKFLKVLGGVTAVAAVCGGVWYFFKNYIKNDDLDDDFDEDDDFEDDDFEDDEDEEGESTPSSSKYVKINIDDEDGDDEADEKSEDKE
ncbi:MAG: hypothetical protein VZR00_02770 [Lachnospiraceae bacterium]|jgi:hypothetical protein|nr:hypothetical protein [Lachnospiraceae bacterium]MEE3460799.1 hypothetical protein [Lachnospiraceae bacterium]